MDYFKAKTKEQLAELHDMAFSNASKATKTTFYQSLKRIEKVYGKPLQDIKLSFISTPKDMITRLEDKKYSENTITTTITNVLKLLKMIDAPLIDYNKWLAILKEKTDKRVATEQINLKNKLKVLMNFTDIRKMVENNAENFMTGEKSLTEYQNFLILSLFTLQIPVRVSNYVGMRVVDDELYLNEKDNFLLVNDEVYKFVFNKYRTSHLIGQKTMLVKDKTLQFLIDKWLAHYNKDSNNFLIVSGDNKRAMNGKQIEKSINIASAELFTTPLTVDNIRASYMKRISELDPDFNDKLDIANILGYSTTAKLDEHYGK